MCSRFHSGFPAAGGGRRWQEVARSPRVCIGYALGDFGKGATRQEKSKVVPAGQERNLGRRVPFSSLRDPVLAGSRLSEPEAVLGKPLARLEASRHRLALLVPAHSSPAFRPGVFLAGPALSTPGTERKLEVVPVRRRVEKPTVNASGAPSL